MKKLLILLSACLLVLASCEPEPVLSLDKTSVEFSEDGGSQTVAVTANNDWTVTADNAFYTVSPLAGSGNGFITVTAQANTTGLNREATVIVTCASRSETAVQNLTVKQFCPIGDAQVKSWEISPSGGAADIIPAEGGTLTLHIEGNAPWLLAWDAQDLQADKAQGLDLTATVVVEVPVCPVFEGRTITFSLSASTQSGSNTRKYAFTQAGGILTYAGETYKTVKMKDGKWWMAENLRYIPSGRTPSDDLNFVTNGIWYPVVVDVLTPETATMKFSKDPDDIKANGYLYNTETALGLKTGDLTVDNCKNYEGVRGICPEGWHIPTKADIVALVGKTNDKNDTNPNAPYYDPDLNGGNASVALLNADGFNAGAWGAVNIGNVTMAKGSLLGAVKSYQGGMNTGYVAGSTLVDTGKNLTTNEDGTLKNCQFLAFMPFIGNGTYNGALNNFRNGVSVRCVKNN